MQYLLKNKQTIPGFIAFAVASWAISLAAVTIIGFSVWIIFSWMYIDALAALPKALLLLVGLCGAYAGLGSVCLWVTMCVYWMAVERGSVTKRILWFLALLLGLHYGALLYAYRVWRTGIVKVGDTVE